jgi:transcriptional regulator with XRE-family HTH domain
MARKNPLTASPPILVETALRELGGRLRAARLARNLTLDSVAQKIGTGRRPVADAEFGKPGVSAAVYVALLWAYDLLDDLKLLADPGRDVVGLAMLRDRERARPNQRRSLDNDF